MTGSTIRVNSAAEIVPPTITTAIGRELEQVSVYDTHSALPWRSAAHHSESAGLLTRLPPTARPVLDQQAAAIRGHLGP